MTLRTLRHPAVRVGVVVAAAAGIVALVWWRGPNWSTVGAAFTAVRWQYVAAAIGLNLLSVIVRAIAWRTIITQAIPAPYPSHLTVFSAFSVGLFANAVLPGRVGELARVAVLTRKLERGRGHDGVWAALIGTVFAHRMFDLLPSLSLILYVVLTAKLPHWAVTSLIVVVTAGLALLTFAIVSARRPNRSRIDELGPIKRVVTMARHGLGVMHSPLPAAVAALFQSLGWLCQLLAVYTSMRAFHIHAPMPAAGLVLVLMNVATLFPLWPGNVGLVQAAVALPLLNYGISKASGIAYGLGLQAIEASVGVGVGLIFLAREGLSFAMLRVMPTADQAEAPPSHLPEETAGAGRSRARIPD